MDMWEFYFNYEAPNCATPGSEPGYNTVVGCTFKARGPETGGSDFLLVELNETPPAAFNVYYNGWDISETGASSGIGIHHPAGDIKKISKSGNLTTGTYTGCIPNAHWQVTWQATATDHGVTEGGSSGSPIFNETSKKVVGTLTGGAASCSAQTSPDFYGKMDVHWDDNGTGNADRLKPWLDPTNSGVTSLDGWDPNATASGLDAAFDVSQSTIPQGGCVNFQDQSTGGPTGWTWTFTGANTTTSTQQNPVGICYDTPGVYDVTLEITNGTDDDTYTCSGCVTVLDPGTDPICAFTASATTIPQGGIVTFTDTSVNGPFVSWAWDFEGGLPATSEVEAPNPVAYLEVGSYDVELRVQHENGNQYVCIKEDYINVVPDATEPPVADFIANYTVIQPGESVDFLDISDNGPYHWEWTFEGGFPASSSDQNPTNITYGVEGEYQVQMICSNSEGSDTVVKEAYIIVSVDDPCTEAPIAAYTATNRLLSAGERTYFQDLSSNYPSVWNWYFGTPNVVPQSSTEASPLAGVEYNTPGIYDVTLSVSNSCGTDVLTKEEYIYVFSGTVYQYCDTLSNVRGGEVPSKMNTPDTWGFIAGHNGEKIRYYADKFDDYTFSQIEALIVPVNNSVYGDYNSTVTFYVWDGSTDYPDSVLAQKSVYIRNIPENFNSVIEFDNPVLVDGPFYVGFKLNYPDENGDGVSDDYFVVSVAGNRGPQESQNTMYVNKANTWYSSVEYFNIATSLAIKPVACLVDISEFDIQNEVYTYPNPTADYLTVELGDRYFDEDVEIAVFDMTGRQLFVDTHKYSAGEYRVDFTNQTSGIYFINVRIGDEVMSKKISVVR
jgi:PKD repeat protein